VAGFRFYLSMKKQSHFVVLVENLAFDISVFVSKKDQIVKAPPLKA
jgi:hypothetical protein